MTPAAAHVIGIARRGARRQPMEEIDAVQITCASGVEGDHKGARFPERAVTILSCDAWAEAVATLADLAGPVPLPWTARRANLLVAGVALPQAAGAIIRIGPVRLEVTAQNYPCRRMDDAHPGLMKALAPDWRGGVCCKVLVGGQVRRDDPVVIEHAPPPHRPRLPG